MIATREPQVQYQNRLARANIFLFTVQHVFQYIIGTWYYSVQVSCTLNFKFSGCRVKMKI